MEFDIRRTQLTVLIVVVVTIMLISTAGRARADVMIEPDNDFWRRNTDKMVSMVHNFYANGEAGYVIFVAEPNIVRESFSVSNGEIIYITYTYTDDAGVIWGVTERNTGNADRTDWKSGWVKMSELQVIYDSYIFYDENKDSFLNRTFNAADYYTDGDFIVWTWPGSGVIEQVIRENLIADGELPIDVMGETIYIDSDGREWGHAAYLYGSRDVWICLTELSNNEIPAFNSAPMPELTAAVEPPPHGQASSGNARNLSSPMMVITLVSLVAMLSLVLIRVLWDRKSKKNQ